jgi:hypothetical protein
MNASRESTSVRRISHLIEEALQEIAEERVLAESQRPRPPEADAAVRDGGPPTDPT